MRSAAGGQASAEAEGAPTSAGKLSVEPSVWGRGNGRGGIGEVVSESCPSQSLNKFGLGCCRLTDP